ncbi:MAG: hypothetical protein CMO40_04465 [Verrucomicrobiaceae bacterium]|nr:hypothetical protein [Verrucomicrobiaceae bacterium]
MDIKLISAELRPRRPWEAIDLGISLGRRHLGRILLFWSLSVVPAIVLLTVLLQPNYLLLFILIWWLKPLFDRVPLFYLSRALFGSAPTLRDFFRALPGLCTRHLFNALVVARFSPTRSSVMPIKELEGLNGPAYFLRRKALMQSGAGHSMWFLAICLFLWFFFTYAFVLFASAAMPTVAPPTPGGSIVILSEFLDSGKIALEPIKILGLLSAWVLALTFTEILYVAGGFGIYLNARTGLEGWDIELTFRRIANRLRRAKSGGRVSLLAASLLFTILPTSTDAQISRGQPGEVIERVLDHEDFEIHTRTEKRKKQGEQKTTDYADSLSFLANVGPFLFWLLVTVLLLILLVLIYRNRHFFRSRDRGSTEKKSRARTILGMNITPESLPDDIARAAREAWNQNRHREALSLLYRGALSWLVESGNSPVRESDTEIDCLGHAQSNPAAQGYFSYIELLTATWTRLAYGSLIPDEDEMEQLLQGWPFNRKEPRE